MTGTHMQTCNKCNTEKELTEFEFRSDTKKYRTQCKKCINKMAYARYKDDKPAELNRRLKYKYGITLKEYTNLLEEQNQVCAICSEPCDLKPRLSVDHDHTTGKLRGLLCDSCNNGLGRFKDNPETLSNAIEYLKSTSA